MNLLLKQIKDIGFDDVVDFCNEKIVESTQLDYKLQIPKDLAKHFATFSNTQGGLIIIGVGEDAKGLPTSSNGITNSSKLIDQIHQIAANVTPLPTYEVCTTDEKNSNVFLLIRIFEGPATPYVTLSDPTVWIRNGNISVAASRDELIRLADKRSSATTLRENLLNGAETYFENRLKSADLERIELLKTKPGAYGETLGGNNCATLFMVFMPFFPSKELVKPSDMLNDQPGYMGEAYFKTMFGNTRAVTMPGGISAFSWNESAGFFQNDQLHVNGMAYTASDILHNTDGSKQISMYEIGRKLRYELNIIQNFYIKTGYSGLVIGRMYLKGGVGAEILPIGSKSVFFMPDNGNVYMPEHQWQLQFDTNQLRDKDSLNVIFSDAIKDISWSLGAGDIPESELEKYLIDNKWKTPAGTTSS